MILSYICIITTDVRRYDLLCSTYLQFLGPMYVTESARTYVLLHDFTYEIHEKRTGWQPCNIS